MIYRRRKKWKEYDEQEGGTMNYHLYMEETGTGSLCGRRGLEDDKQPRWQRRRTEVSWAQGPGQICEEN